ncbi:hypothetical protein [Pseudogemmobacter faecipullorum]|uniref:Uncharacterized protein n=1 Tax=Pseudogemmobacter faecipullorum TaxID=2755041 RepID=A0ABS8CHM5_9RHOB|nr:hypothetical protein [Pseudogemmobacter faecipullorum]MCB5408395.1 hypothetical protein [Pseudogemmobacter faecipullorum]
MTAAFAPGTPAAGFVSSHAMAPLTAGQGMTGICVVRLIDRRTGLTHRVNGTPLVIFTRRPSEASAELLSGRDRSIWEVRTDPIEP